MQRAIVSGLASAFQQRLNGSMLLADVSLIAVILGVINYMIKVNITVIFGKEISLNQIQQRMNMWGHVPYRSTLQMILAYTMSLEMFGNGVVTVFIKEISLNLCRIGL